jgi:hypothetical protein
MPRFAHFLPLPARRTLIVALASGLVACQSPGKPPAEPGTGKPAPSPGVEARLAPSNGSAGQGTAKFVVRGDSLVALVSVAGLIMGSYRVSITRPATARRPTPSRRADP